MLATGAHSCRVVPVVLALLLAAASLSVSRAAAAGPTARLVYTRGPGAETCPDEGELRRAVAVRVGHDPFSASAPLTVAVEMVAVEGHLRGRIVIETGGIESGSQAIDEARRLGGDRADCEDLLNSIALAVSVALDADKVSVAAVPEVPPPPATAVAPPVPATPPEVGPDTVPEAKPAVPLVLGRAPRVSLWVAPGVRASFGAWSHVAVAPDLFVEARYRWLGFGVEGRYDLPVTVHVGSNDQATVGRGTGSVVPCAHIRWFTACGVATFGVTQARGAIPTGSALDAPYVALGGRVGADLALVPRFHLLGTVDLDGILTPFRIDGGSATTESFPVEASAGIALLVSIF